MAKMDVAKVTLSTGKIVLMRMMKISHSELAAQAVAKKAGGDGNLLQMLMQKELVKLLLVKIDDKELSGNDKEDLDNLFTMSEYTQLLRVVGKLSGGDEMGKEPQIDLVPSGDK